VTDTNKAKKQDQFWLLHTAGYENDTPTPVGPFGSVAEATDFRNSRVDASFMRLNAGWLLVTNAAVSPEEAQEVVEYEVPDEYGSHSGQRVRLLGMSEDGGNTRVAAKKARLAHERQVREEEQRIADEKAAEAARLAEAKAAAQERLHKQDKAAEVFARDNDLDLQDARRMLGLPAAPAPTE